VCQGVDGAQYPRTYDHLQTCPFIHVDGIMERVADGHKMILGHGCQE
jgi:hypothetical protein